MNGLGIAPGETARHAGRITAEDIDTFARLSGDHDPVHVDAAYAATTPFGRRIAHGALVMGLLSAAAAEISRRALARGCAGRPVSAGYDRIRFTRPVFAGDALEARYTVEEVDPARRRSWARVEVLNQAGETCLTGRHVMAWVAG